MREADVEFPDDGNIWVDFRYEGLPSYCLICGKVGHVTRRCGEGRDGDKRFEEDMETLYDIKRARCGG